MAPKRDVGFVDLEAKYFLGLYVVIHWDDNQAPFKQLIIENGHKFLKAANPN
ncbi:S24 family peptidase [Pseudoalteromonas sp. 20-92]|uniref:S24 family peptidase n=1 Tax=Pseudoalteromonas sp. TaxID=53249 RepID=UPI002355F5B0|nr:MULTISPECIES: S24 family peptidase [unclassified Pseudoalteromonas]MDQ2045555.1 S24 family peptidase [Pseudoalteromonas sp. 20-92]